jgi:hypothetical protein
MNDSLQPPRLPELKIRLSICGGGRGPGNKSPRSQVESLSRPIGPATILHHSPGRTLGISAIYIRHRYLAERREALEAWAEHVLELVQLVRLRESQEKRTVA